MPANDVLRAVAFALGGEELSANERKLIARIERAKQMAAEAIASGSVVTQVAAADDKSDLRIWQQGNEDYYSDEALKQRFTLRTAPEIELILNLFWETSLRSEGGDDNIRSDALGQLGHSLCLLPIFCALMEEYDEEDARSAIAEDWVRDRRGEELLPREYFCDALFELADVWTKGISCQEYRDFLLMLLEHTTGVSREHIIATNGSGLVFLDHNHVERLEDVHAEKVDELPRLAKQDLHLTSRAADWSKVDKVMAASGTDDTAVAVPASKATLGNGLAANLASAFAATGARAPAADSTALLTWKALLSTAGWRARGKLMKMRRAGAMAIQAGARGHRDRSTANDRRGANVALQAGARGRQARKAADERRTAVQTIQSGGRGRLGRSEANQRRGAVNALQSLARGRLARKTAGKRRYAVLAVQAGARGLLGRLAWREIYEDVLGDREARKAHRYRVRSYDHTRSSSSSPTIALRTQQFAMEFPQTVARVRVGKSLSQNIIKHGSRIGFVDGSHITSNLKMPNLNQNSRLFDFLDAKKPSNEEHTSPVKVVHHQPYQHTYAWSPTCVRARSPQEQGRGRPESVALAQPSAVMGSRAEQDAKSRMIKEVEELLHSQTGRLEQMRRNFEETKTQALLKHGIKVREPVPPSEHASKVGYPTRLRAGRDDAVRSRTNLRHAASVPCLPHRQIPNRSRSKVSAIARSLGNKPSQEQVHSPTKDLSQQRISSNEHLSYLLATGGARQRVGKMPPLLPAIS